MNYRTIISFGEKNIDFLMNKYNSLLEEPLWVGVRNAHLSGVLFGYSQFIRFAFTAFIFYIASIFIKKYADGQESSFIAIYILFMSALGSGM